MSMLFARLMTMLGIGVVSDRDVAQRLHANERRIDRLEVRVRALEADVAARVEIEMEADRVAAADQPNPHR